MSLLASWAHEAPRCRVNRSFAVKMSLESGVWWDRNCVPIGPLWTKFCLWVYIPHYVRDGLERAVELCRSMLMMSFSSDSVALLYSTLRKTTTDNVSRHYWCALFACLFFGTIHVPGPKSGRELRLPRYQVSPVCFFAGFFRSRMDFVFETACKDFHCYSLYYGTFLSAVDEENRGIVMCWFLGRTHRVPGSSGVVYGIGQFDVFGPCRPRSGIHAKQPTICTYRLIPPHQSWLLSTNYATTLHEETVKLKSPRWNWIKWRNYIKYRYAKPRKNFLIFCDFFYSPIFYDFFSPVLKKDGAIACTE